MTKKRTIIMICGFVAFAVIAGFVAAQHTLAFDTVIRQWFYSIRSEQLTAVLKVITYMGNWQSITGLCLLLLIIPKTRTHYGIPVSSSAFFITLLNKGVKTIFKRPRPDVSLHLIEQGGYSFTSGHSITSMVVFGLLIFLVRKYVKDRRTANMLTVLLCVPLVFIGLSRIYMGVHFPTDVLGGWCLGLAVLMIIVSIEDRLTTGKEPKL
ncbi:MAG: phosphatase PAP2 family protein [Firmicutes bacterium]|jgi:undecaprenyl-diphosphatase|nr:phosphatase PAP2 family protein [Bacillota bacterium]